ncbi:protein phosphatase type 1 complex subunit hex2 [Diplodia corticola]|uniref:Protein phosphatase type 1 complex subunit hex2 n=1 Tax=Diplodia corticola TaxID=236234 RepID=A0A1J9S0R8_9PEZI|nr:protein phosphatase type 1 complex subunit hex2 [Diplodia corticola]OJD34175.1 protein phosphatase type 1 complex subunit hex2 [Diplodia corticola]
MDNLGLISGSHPSSRFSLDELRRSLFDDLLATPAPASAPTPTPPSPQPPSIADNHDDDLTPPSPPPLFSSPESIAPCAVTSLTNGSPAPANTHDTRDDLFLRRSDPSRHVDYLSQDWHEDDICSSWRHITVNRHQYGQVSRLENASWRAWAKSRFQLATVLPETLNWFKERDITWLYGPLQQSTTRDSGTGAATRRDVLVRAGDPLVTAAAAAAPRPRPRSILKKMNALETMTRRSSFSLSVLRTQHAATAAAAAAALPQQSSPSQRPGGPLGRSHSTPDFLLLLASSSSPSSNSSNSSSSSISAAPAKPPRKSEKPHIRFNEVVEQRISLRRKDLQVAQHEQRKRGRGLAALDGDAAMRGVEEEGLADDEDEDGGRDEGVVMKGAGTGRRGRRGEGRARGPALEAGAAMGGLETIRKLPDGLLRTVGRKGAGRR